MIPGSGVRVCGKPPDLVSANTLVVESSAEFNGGLKIANDQKLEIGDAGAALRYDTANQSEDPLLQIITATGGLLEIADPAVADLDNEDWLFPTEFGVTMVMAAGGNDIDNRRFLSFRALDTGGVGVYEIDAGAQRDLVLGAQLGTKTLTVGGDRTSSVHRALAPFVGAVPPAVTALAGDMYFDTDTNKLMVYNGSAWEQVTSAVP